MSEHLLAESSNQSPTQVIGDNMDENPLSEYEQERLKRINENNKTLLKLVYIPDLFFYFLSLKLKQKFQGPYIRTQ